MNMKEVTEKSEMFFSKLKGFRETIDNNIVEIAGFYNSVAYAQILKELVQFISDNREEMKKVFSYMKISLKNEARQCIHDLDVCELEQDSLQKVNGTVNLAHVIKSLEECSKKVSSIKFLFERLDNGIKILDKPIHTFKNYSDTMDRYKRFNTGVNGKRPMESKVGKAFRTSRGNIIKLLGSLELPRFSNTNFEYLVVTSGHCQDLDEEIVRDERYLKNYPDNPNRSWLNADNDK